MQIVTLQFLSLRILAAGMLCLAGACQTAMPPETERAHRAPPNIILIVADDLGYSDLGSFGGEIATPNLDALAARGTQLTNFYVSPTCSPTRSMLLTGLDNHQAGFGTMAELVQASQLGRPGYEGHIPSDVPTLAEKLQMRGFRTIMSGKWHLGSAAEYGPSARGFDRSFVLVEGAHNHFGGDETPEFARFGASPSYRLNGAPVSWPDGGYSSDVFTDYALSFMHEARANAEPFFVYLSFTAPHWPLQAPAAAIMRQKGAYDAGPERIAEARLKRMKALGLLDVTGSRHGTVEASDWDLLDPLDRKHEARKMEVYAAMVEMLDSNIGRIVENLRKTGSLENTIIIFISDNGAEQTVFEFPINPMKPGQPLPVPTDNSTENLGAATSYFSYGPAWASVSSSPFAGFKGSVREGGIRAPAIVAGPGIATGTRERSVLHVRDIFPTILALAGAAIQADSNGSGTGGINVLPLLADPSEGPTPRPSYLYWELFYRAAIREGDLKAVFQPNRLPILGDITQPGEVDWELYDLSKDPLETKNIAAERSRDLRRLRAKWLAESDKLGVVLLDETVH